MVLRDTSVFTLLFILNLEISPGTTDLLTWNGDNTLLNDEVPWRNLSQLSQLERSSRFNLTVIILTMNRPESLQRLLDSIDKTFFEFSEDKLNLEIHVDKSQGYIIINFFISLLNHRLSQALSKFYYFQDFWLFTLLCLLALDIYR